ncbi:MAG TPA: hypothetical protein VI432_01660 [Candidatus Paceibacterota bacterium]
MKIKRSNKIRIIEFLVIGVLMGVIEDILAISLATDSKINPHVIWIVFIVAIPFAFLSEIVVDHPDFWKRIFPDKNKDNVPDFLEKKIGNANTENKK